MNNRPALARLAAAAAFCFILWSGAQAQTTTFQINSLGDGPKSGSAGVGVCWTGSFIGDTPPFAPECTLRAAIQAANELSGQINFEFAEIPVGSNQFSRITIGSALPTVTSRIQIRGQTHPFWSAGRANVRIQGSVGTIQNYNALRFGAGSDQSRVESVGIIRVNDAITIQDASNLTITNSFLAGGLANSISTARNGRDGLRLINSNQNVITNNFLRGNNRYGIYLASGSNTNIIASNRFGVRPGGNSSAPSPDSANGGAGIFVASSAGEGNQLGSFAGNYFANNDNSAIRVFGGGQLITNNRIGLPPVEGVAVNFEAEDYANRGDSAIFLASSGNQVGTGTSTGNVIGNADQIGILVGRLTPSAISADDNLIAGNRIGLDEDDTAFGMSDGIQLLNGSGTTVRNNIIANNVTGIRAQADSSGSAINSNQILNNDPEGIRVVGGATIGGGSLATGNVIGGNNRGIFVFDSVLPVLIRNNYIGTNAEAANLGNTTGIQVQSNNSYVDVGMSGNGNVIGNNSATGLFMASSANDVRVQSNYIGVHPDGTPIGNQRGITVSGSLAAFENRIGYRVTDTIVPLDWLNDVGRGNVIAHNSGPGIRVTGGDAAVGNSIRGNRFFANGGRDIDLGMNEIDPGGSATGPNTQLNWPEFAADLTDFNPTTGVGRITLRLRSLPSNTSYPLLVDVYLLDPNNPDRPALVHTLEYPETAGANGNLYQETFDWPTGLPFSGQLVATATDQPGGPFANTSQFSAEPVSIGPGPDALGTVIANNGSGGVFLDLQAVSETVSVTGFDLSFTGTPGTSVSVAVLVKDGSYQGHEDDPSPWLLHDTVTYQRGDNPQAFSAAALGIPIQIAPGQVKGVYLQALAEDGISYSGTGSAPPQTNWNDGVLNLFSDTATTAGEPFDGPLFSPRSFSGIVRYESEVIDQIFSDRFAQ